MNSAQEKHAALIADLYLTGDMTYPAAIQELIGSLEMHRVEASEFLSIAIDERPMPCP